MLDEMTCNDYDSAMPRNTEPFTDQLRAAIENCGKTRYQISKDTGIAQEALSRFVNRNRDGLSMASIDTLFDYLGLKISKR